MLKYAAIAATTLMVAQKENTPTHQIPGFSAKKRNFRWIWSALAALLCFGTTSYATAEGYLVGRHILSGISVSFILTLLVAVLARKKNEN